LELARVLDLSLPAPGETLADWQAVALGGGVVNGVSQSGAWPQRRIAEMLAQAPALQERWERVDDLAAGMANDDAIPMSTRYDALRILGAFPWDDWGETLSRFLGANVDAELQMGAVSAVGDMESRTATQALIMAIPQLEEGNRRVAVAALLRTEERRTLLARSILHGAILRDELMPGELAELQPTIDLLGK
jgi:hypothetical protein